ncbi:hypothetical protein IE81DRAFT_35631 [Ceraceosorus guamensis]|uniref:Uncharacterized protein n=1 Tax=Ceraceosorus guamensis TaxID=1522189 RepID=A0A316W358_9BASI|nr:hypothetical protein IE81DRAFT_35631 [Ceraceosorus guamensis]PWN44129.1 hypothetical protein IE81DRAFT_35631 [Ceraceosorus guamensis]
MSRSRLHACMHACCTGSATLRCAAQNAHRKGERGVGGFHLQARPPELACSDVNANQEWSCLTFLPIPEPQAGWLAERMTVPRAAGQNLVES